MSQIILIKRLINNVLIKFTYILSYMLHIYLHIYMH